MPESFVYSITNNINKKVYVGKTNNPKNRWEHHRCTNKRGWVFLISRSIRKYGVNGAKRRGVPLTPERRANMSAAQKGRPKSPEHIAKVVAAKRAAKLARQTQS